MPNRRRPHASPLMSAVAIGLLAATACSSTPSSTSATTTPGSTGAVGKEADAGKAQVGGLLNVAIGGETDSFNPFSGAWSAASYTVANSLFDPLTALDPDGVAKPYLAESFEPDATFMTWTITLRQGVNFHDGTPVDAAAVKRNLDTAKTSGLTSQAFTAMKSSAIEGDRKVIVTMNTPWSSFSTLLSSQAGYMAAPSMLDDPAGAEAKVVGSGPFKVSERRRDSFVKVERNGSYWQKDKDGQALPYLDGIDFKIIPDPDSRQKAVQADDVDAAEAPSAHEVVAAKERAKTGAVNLLTDERAETDETVLAFNTAKEPFNDLVARQAVAAATDQQGLADTALENGVPPAWGLFEEGSPWYISEAEAGYPGHDLDKAKALAAQYEQAHGKPLQFALTSLGDAQSLLIAQNAQAQLAEAGIKMDISTVELTVLINKVILSPDYEAAGFVIWSSPSPDQGYLFLATAPNPTGLSLNFPRLDQPELRAAFDEFRSTGDPAQQKAAIAKVQRELAKNLPVVFLWHNRSVFVYSKHVHGFAANTFPQTDIPAIAPYATTPFYTHVWLDR